MDRVFDPTPAATLLMEAWHRGILLSDLPAVMRPRSMSEGYDIQDLVVSGLNTDTAGWKLGLGSAAAKRLSGLGKSLAGRILRSRLHPPDELVSLPNSAPVTIEFEIAYVLSRDILPTEGAFSVPDSVAECRVSFELVRSRFIDRRAVGWPSFAADNAGFEALILSEALAPSLIERLPAGLLVSCNGEFVARGLIGEEATDPAQALFDLIIIARERNIVLTEGSIISTGTVSKPFDIAAETAEIKATFPGGELAFSAKRSPTNGHSRATGDK